MLVLTKGDDFHGFVGMSTGVFVDGVEVCIGDVVSIGRDDMHNANYDIVAIFKDKISVMGYGSTPLSKLNVLSIVKNHSNLIEGSMAGKHNDFRVVNFVR